MAPFSYYKYYNFDNENFFTMILKPEKQGRFPVVLMRSPYESKEKTEEELLKEFTDSYKSWAEAGYTFVFSHCRGRGKSTGAFIPYIHEREDGFALLSEIRKEDFYNGEIYLVGGSYNASLHYCTAPFDDDIKGAVFNVQDCERYRLWYRNGQMRRGHANWHFNLYKDKCGLDKKHTEKSFSEFPIKGLSVRVLGEYVEDFEQMLLAEHFENDFWQTRYGGNDARDALKNTKIPVLLTTGYNDFYVGGMFKMWNEMEKDTKDKCAMIVSPYNHGDSYDKENGISFPDSSVSEHFGKDYRIRWFNAIRKNEPTFIKTGVITYYRAFENKWCTDFYKDKTIDTVIKLGETEKTLIYDPENPPSFSAEGITMKDQTTRKDVITLYTDEFEKDTFVKGKMKLSLTVSSDCADTSFYVAIGLGDYTLRHDITSLCYQKGDYNENEKISLEFEFDEYAFLIKKGQKLRIDIAPTDENTYVCHSNQKGQYATIKTPKIARNKVFLNESYLILPTEN